MNKTGFKSLPLIDLPEGYEPSDKEAYMCVSQLEYFRRKLIRWKESLEQESNKTIDHLQEDSSKEADLNDIASKETDFRTELRRGGRYYKLMCKIEAALHRIEQRSYGYCKETGEPIGIQRLIARPVATLCIEAQEMHEREKKQHRDDEYE